MLEIAKNYKELADQFNWHIPEYYNIGVDVCDKWADTDPKRLALIHKSQADELLYYSFDDIKTLSNRTAQLFTEKGIQTGDRVGILLPQAPETAFSHVAIYKMGAIAVPLFTLFGEDALEYRLNNCAAKAVITNSEGARKLISIRNRLTHLETIFNIDGAETGCQDFHASLQHCRSEFTPVHTKADDPALIIYTSGTTGQPKGVLHAHRVLLGHLPGVEISHNFFPQNNDLIWTPADWAWIGGLLDVLMPAWHHGIPVIAYRFEKFDAEAAVTLISELQIRNLFLPPTALKMMRSVPIQKKRLPLNVRSIASGGESLGIELLDWSVECFGVKINEFYGQTECNMIVSSCNDLFPIKPGVMGRPVPGHRLSIIDEAGNILDNGQLGNIGVHRPDPVMFLEYWHNPVATKERFVGDWLLTGDKGIMDDEGYIRFIGRDDDVITSAGYRIGPGEIEDCLLGHPAVVMAAVIGVPDTQRTEIIKAFIVPEDGYARCNELVKDIQAYVKLKLAAHEYPRVIEFVDALPLTTTGKVIRKALRERHETATA